MGGKKRKKGERGTIHPRNKYSEKPPDFALLASLYPSFHPHVFYSRDGRPRIDWTDYNSTRELTRVLLLHYHSLTWWIPDGQLCPTVPNRLNYIHWVEDLLSSDIIPKTNNNMEGVMGFDIGTGANCIYPLLGASLLGWSFVGSDVTDVALEWAERNVKSNPHISELIEIRKVQNEIRCERSLDIKPVNDESGMNIGGRVGEEAETLYPASVSLQEHAGNGYSGPPVILGVVKEGEKFDFCMCNPPFFEIMEEAGLNPKTSCGGTPVEMVCPGGEKAFITRIIEDSAVLKDTFRWYTSMVGRKANLKILISKLWEVGVTVVKTTEFVQGQTCRWGLAWSFFPPVKRIIAPHVPEKNTISFMLEGIHRQFGAFHVLQSVHSFFCSSGASCKLDISAFTADISASNEQCNAIIEADPTHSGDQSNNPSSSLSANNLCFHIMVFQQTPGTLLVKGSLRQRDNADCGCSFSSIMQLLEETLRHKFCREKGSVNMVHSDSCLPSI